MLSATCHDLLDYVTPLPAQSYESTARNWKSESARPILSTLIAVEQCVSRTGDAVNLCRPAQSTLGSPQLISSAAWRSDA